MGLSYLSPLKVFPTGRNGALSLTSATLVLNPGTVKDYASISLNIGSTIESDSGVSGWLIIGCSNNFSMPNGTNGIYQNGGDDLPGTYTATAPNGIRLSYTIPSSNGGAGGGTSGATGGAQSTGNGGGGAKVSTNGGAASTFSGGNGAGTSGGAGGGGNGDAGEDALSTGGGGGGGGGYRGFSGSGLALFIRGTITKGLLANIEVGGVDGGPGGAGNGALAGGGGGGAGGNGGKIFARVRTGQTLNAGELNWAGGPGGAGGGGAGTGFDGDPGDDGVDGSFDEASMY